MDYRELFKESNKEVEERFLLTRERIGEIAAGEKNGMKEQVHRYFKKTAQFLEKCASDFLCISSLNSFFLNRSSLIKNKKLKPTQITANARYKITPVAIRIRGNTML